MRRSHKTWMGLGLLAFATACSSIQSVDAGVCGNGVLEAGEDCDGSGEACIPAGREDACRLSCSEVACPDGWGCGEDGLCRQASTRFAALGVVLPDASSALDGADLDGDGRGDLVVLGQAGLSLVFFDAQSRVETLASLAGVREAPVWGLLDGVEDRHADLVAIRQNGLAVLRGRGDRSLASVAYSPYQIPDVDPRVVVLDALRPAGDGLVSGPFLGDEVLVFSALEVVAANQTVGKIGNMPKASNTLIGQFAVGNFLDTPGSPCEELVVPYTDQDWVDVYSPCEAGADGVSWAAPRGSAGETFLTPVILPVRSTVSERVLAEDVNFDGRLDLLIGATPAGSPDSEAREVYVAYGIGDGRFHSVREDVDRAVELAAAEGRPLPEVFGVPDGSATLLDGLEAMPLDVGDLNADDVLDFVLPQGVRLSVSTTRYVSVNAPERAWTEARIADFNANGVPDVVASDGESRELVFFNGAGEGLFNRFSVSTRGRPGELAIGDFDGDLVTDVALQERGYFDVEGASEPGDSLSIAFGNPTGAPSAPVSMGQLGSIQQVLAGDFAFGGNLDGITDLLVTSETQAADGAAPTTVALFYGSSDRRLESPFLFARSDFGGQLDSDTPVATVVAQLDQDPERHPDVAALALGEDGLRLWRLPMLGAARVDASQVHYSDPLPAEFGARPGLVALDLDGAEPDELVLITPAGLQVVRSTPDGFAFDPLQPLPDSPVAQPGAAQTRDVDQDGRQDLSLLVEDDAGKRRVVVFSSRGGDTLAAPPLELEAALDGDLRAHAWANLDQDPQLELLLLDEDGLQWAELAPDAAALSLVGALPGVAAAAAGGETLTTGDFDGDGVADVAVASAAGVRVYRGLPVTE